MTADLTDLEWMERVARPSWRQAAAVGGAFIGAFGLGTVLALLTHPGSGFARGAAGLALLLVLMLGYQLWVAHVVSVFVRGLFGALRRALVWSFFSRRKAAVAAEAAALRDRLRDPAVLGDLMGRIRAKTRVFRTVGAALGVPMGLAFGIAGSRLGVPLTFALYLAAAVGYGAILARLGWLGYLPLPEDLGS